MVQNALFMTGVSAAARSTQNLFL